jgi:hypothetical protein
MTTRAKTHKDVEYAVDDASGRERIFKTADEAAGFAVSLALSDGRPHNVDVLVYSAAGARWFGGNDAEDQYQYDPEASVFERIEVRATSHGRIP